MSIQDLSLEILVNVIHLVCLPTDGAMDHVAAARLALVCRKWHRTIVDTPHLWTQLDGIIPFNILEKCLDRSRGVALRLVRARRPKAMSTRNFYRIVEELDRIKEASFVFQGSDWMSLAREGPFLDHAPLLERFHLQIRDEKVDTSSVNGEEGRVDADEEGDSVGDDEEESIGSAEEEDSGTDMTEDENDRDEADDGRDIVEEEGEGEDEDESGEEEEEDTQTDSDDDVDSSPRYTLPAHIFSGCKPPRLRRLSLSNIRVP
ncbi:hypothetical protein ONZ45_g6029 [Pleurotus djamor]|nr:hypothetical protein ONZ45_g6029 [Pleurotus djamor]